MPEQLTLNFDGPPLSPEQRAVLRLLRRGRGNAIRRIDLSEATGIGDTQVRQIIKEIVEEKGILIASATAKPAGYYLPETREEYGQGVAQLIHRITSLARRVRAMDRQAYEHILGGARLEL